jgi:hypothetical protein
VSNKRKIRPTRPRPTKVDAAAAETIYLTSVRAAEVPSPDATRAFGLELTGVLLDVPEGTPDEEVTRTFVVDREALLELMTELRQVTGDD